MTISAASLTHAPEEDLRLVSAAQSGDLDALDALVRRHQAWILHLAQRMLWNREDAEDAAQEILFKAITSLATFERRSEFRTWLYRIAGNYLLDRCRAAKTFEGVARTLAEIPDRELPDPNTTRLETAVLVEEAKMACTTGILLCLDPRQRMAFLLGEILGVKDDVGAEVLDTSPANFRQILSRARRELYGFLRRQCGLANEENSCRCANKVSGFIERKFVDPSRLPFASGRVSDVKSAAPDRLQEIRDFERRYAMIFREHAVVAPPDLASRIRSLVEQTGIGKSMGFEQ